MPLLGDGKEVWASAAKMFEQDHTAEGDHEFQSAPKIVVPKANVPDLQRLYGDNLIKAWALVTFSGGTPSVVAGTNIKRDKITDVGTGETTLFFETPMPSVKYAVFPGITTGTTVDHTIISRAKSATQFTIYTETSGAPADLDFQVAVLANYL